MKNRFRIIGIIISIAAMLVSCGDVEETDESGPTVTTFAGTAGDYGSADGTGTGALFTSPSGITMDGTNLYVVDYGNHTIRKIVISSKMVTTFAGTAGSSGSEDGVGTTARFNNPFGITTDGTNLYVVDYGNHTIRKIVISSKVVTTFAGTAGSSGSEDGVGTSARFNSPFSITTDGSSLYVADYGNHTIRKIVIATGEITTLAGEAGAYGSIDGIGTDARFYYPAGITTDGTNVYVADTGNSTVRKIVIATGEVTTIAGKAETNGSANGTGTNARFDGPFGITTDGTNVYVADTGNSTVRKIVIATGKATTIAGKAGYSGSVDGTGTNARFNYLLGITMYKDILYVADTGNNTIRKIYWD